MKKRLFLTAGALEILFWSLFFRQMVLYLGQNEPSWNYGFRNYYGWPIESGPPGWELTWSSLFLNLAIFSGLFLVVCAAAFCLSGKSRERWFLAYAVPTLPLALAGILISIFGIYHRQFIQTVLIVNFLVQMTFLLFSVVVLFLKWIQRMLGYFKAERS